MRTVRFDEYGDDDVLKVVEVPEPAPGPGEVLVQMRAAAVNPFGFGRPGTWQEYVTAAEMARF